MSLVENLYRDYGDFQIDIPRWEISDQGVTALIGASGSGKTSVFRLLIGLEPAQSLSWKFQEVDLAKLPVPARRLGVVFQKDELFPHLTARENIFFAAKARRISEADRDLHLKRLAGALKMESFLDRKAAALSGGERQRTALIRALIGRPRMLLLDEPFSALDEELREESRLLVREAIELEKVPALLVTHDAQDVRVLGDQIQKISQGRLVGQNS